MKLHLVNKWSIWSFWSMCRWTVSHKTVSKLAYCWETLVLYFVFVFFSIISCVDEDEDDDRQHQQAAKAFFISSFFPFLIFILIFFLSFFLSFFLPRRHGCFLRARKEDQEGFFFFHQEHRQIWTSSSFLPPGFLLSFPQSFSCFFIYLFLLYLGVSAHRLCV